MLKTLLKIFLLGAACVVLFVGYVWFSMATYRGVCLRQHSGYEKHTLFENGRETKNPLPDSPGWFPAWQQPAAFEAAGITYDNYELVVECGANRAKTWAVNAVRFSVAPDFKFVPSSQYKEASGDYLPLKARQRTGLPGRPELSWLRPEDKNGPPGHKEFIEWLEIGLLKEEPLDEAHLMGIWQGGWLFRSAKRAYYVWIY